MLAHRFTPRAALAGAAKRLQSAFRHRAALAAVPVGAAAATTCQAANGSGLGIADEQTPIADWPAHRVTLTWPDFQLALNRQHLSIEHKAAELGLAASTAMRRSIKRASRRRQVWNGAYQAWSQCVCETMIALILGWLAGTTSPSQMANRIGSHSERPRRLLPDGRGQPLTPPDPRPAGSVSARGQAALLPANRWIISTARATPFSAWIFVPSAAARWHISLSVTASSMAWASRRAVSF